VIGYPSGQDGTILPPRDTGFVPQGKFIMFLCFIPYNKSFIDQACSVKMAGYWPRSFFCVFMDLDFVSVHKHAEKELGQYPAILTSHLVNNPYLLLSVICCCSFYVGCSPHKVCINLQSTGGRVLSKKYRGRNYGHKGRVVRF